MKNNAHTNPCIRCGTERIVARTWEEKLDNSTITNIEMVCPNPECQKQVVKNNKKTLDRYTSLKRKSELREINRRASHHLHAVKK